MLHVCHSIERQHLVLYWTQKRALVILGTIHFGNATEKEKDAFTRVLKGFIAVATAVFPPNAPVCNNLCGQFRTESIEHNGWLWMDGWIEREMSPAQILCPSIIRISKLSDE